MMIDTLARQIDENINVIQELRQEIQKIKSEYSTLLNLYVKLENEQKLKGVPNE